MHAAAVIGVVFWIQQCYGLGGGDGKPAKPGTNTDPCDQNGKWSDWTPCSKTCGKGTRTRTRYVHPDCDQPKKNEAVCNLGPCSTRAPPTTAPKNPCEGLGQWTDWGKCSKTCEGGVQSRNRDVPEGCEESATEHQACNIQPCPTTAPPTTTSKNPCEGLGEWNDWGKCTKTCGGGVQSRNRDVPVGCEESATEHQACNVESCPTTAPPTTTPKRGCGSIGEWSSWNECTKTCGCGRQSRTRQVPMDCRRPGTELQACNTQTCPGSTEVTTVDYTTCSYYCTPLPSDKGSMGCLSCVDEGPRKVTPRCSCVATGTVHSLLAPCQGYCRYRAALENYKFKQLFDVVCE